MEDPQSVVHQLPQVSSHTSYELSSFGDLPFLVCCVALILLLVQVFAHARNAAVVPPVTTLPLATISLLLFEKSAIQRESEFLFFFSGWAMNIF
jgi:hypothetical protein